MGCEQQESCPFFSEFNGNASRPQYQLFIRSYCLGPLKESCRRLAYERQCHAPAPDNLCPNGYRYRSGLPPSPRLKMSDCEA